MLLLVSAGLLALQLVSSAPLVLDARATQFINRVVTFGDSLSDNGTGAYTVSDKTWPADPHYYGHRFSNGRVYAEVVASTLGVPLTDYAIGGATTSNDLVQGYTGPGSTIPVPSVLDQIDGFLKTSKASTRKTLFILYGGANDAFFGIPTVTAADSVKELQRGVAKLKAAGATYILLPTLPALTKEYPFSALVPSYERPLAKFSRQHRDLVLAIASKDNKIASVDFWSLFSTWYQNPTRFGFDPEKVDISCLRGVYMEVPGSVTVCSDPRKYIFWDEYHPTGYVHGEMGKAAVAALRKKGWVQ